MSTSELLARLAAGASDVRDAARVAQLCARVWALEAALAEIAAGDEPQAAALARGALTERSRGGWRED